jgi:hypothetical protein
MEKLGSLDHNKHQKLIRYYFLNNMILKKIKNYLK